MDSTAFHRCTNDDQCTKLDKNLNCDYDSDHGFKICKCDRDLKWINAECKSSESETAQLVIILVPVISASCFTLVIALLCCCWANKSTRTLKKEFKKEFRRKSESIDLHAMESATNSSNTSNGLASKYVEKKSGRRRSSTVQRELPEIAVNGISNESKVKESTGKSPAKPKPKEAPVVSIDNCSNDNIVPKDVPDSSGYKANLKLLLERPVSGISMDTRKLDAISLMPTDGSLFNNMRPNSAVSFTYGRCYSPINLDGPTWLKSRPNSALGIQRKTSAGYQRPYLTDLSKRPPVQPQKPDELRDREIMELYDEIQTLEETKEKRKGKKKAKKDTYDEGIEEIKIVRKAVSAFKKRRRMREVVKNPTKMETVADKVLKLRIQEGVTAHPNPYSRHQMNSTTSLNSRGKRRNSSASNSTTNTLKNRPESVAQRILRERQEQNLKTRFLVDSAKPASKLQSASSSSKTMPLHLALRQSAKQRPGQRSLGQPISKVPNDDAQPKKSILKKSKAKPLTKHSVKIKQEWPTSSARNGQVKENGSTTNGDIKRNNIKKSNGYVNSAFEPDHGDIKQPKRRVTVDVH